MYVTPLQHYAMVAQGRHRQCLGGANRSRMGGVGWGDQGWDGVGWKDIIQRSVLWLPGNSTYMAPGRDFGLSL